MIDYMDRQQLEKSEAAIRTLNRLGYTWTGGSEWRPPLGPVPNFDLLDAKDAEIGRLKDRIEHLEDTRGMA